MRSNDFITQSVPAIVKLGSNLVWSEKQTDKTKTEIFNLMTD